MQRTRVNGPGLGLSTLAELNRHNSRLLVERQADVLFGDQDLGDGRPRSPSIGLAGPGACIGAVLAITLRTAAPEESDEVICDLERAHGGRALRLG